MDLGQIAGGSMTVVTVGGVAPIAGVVVIVGAAGVFVLPDDVATGRVSRGAPLTSRSPAATGATTSRSEPGRTPRPGERRAEERRALMSSVALSPPPIRRPVARPTPAGRALGRRATSPRQHPLAPRAFLLLALLAALALGLAPLLTAPAVVPAGAPATAFSAERAVRHLEVLAAEPHPMGSAQHDAAAAYVVGELESLGLAPEVQVSSSAGPAADFAGGSVPAGRVRNVLARLPGTDSTAPDVVGIES